MLVDYSDSDEDADVPAVAGPALPEPQAPVPAPLQAAAEPPAKKIRKEINLQHLLQRSGVALPFEDANKLPDDFFDSAPAREEDAGDKAGAIRGWAALSSMLPPPRNAGKKSSALSNSLYANAKPLHGPPMASAATPSSRPPDDAMAAQGAVSHTSPAVGPAGALAVCRADPHASSHASSSTEWDGSGGGDDDGAPSHSVPPTTLRPRLNTSIYDEQPASAEEAVGSVPGVGLVYELPAGPAMGPPTDDGTVGGYAEAGFDHGSTFDLSDGKVVDISQADLRKVMGDAKQYDFAPAPQPEVKIAANFWSRTSGTVEAHYQPSSLQKRKHQINSLAADAAARSSEIAARGTKGMKSKKETAAKYGW